MKRWGVLIAGVLFLMLMYSIWLSQNPTYPDVNVDQVLNHTETLMSERFGGRATGTRGNEKAVDYIETSLLDVLKDQGNETVSLERQTFNVPVMRYENTPEFSYSPVKVRGQISKKENLSPDPSADKNRTRLKYGEDFLAENRPRSGNVDFYGQGLVVTDSIYDIDPVLIEGKVLMTRMNRVTNDFIDDVIDRGALGVLNQFTNEFDPDARHVSEDTSLNLRVDWKTGDSIFIGSLSVPAFDFLKDEAKKEGNLIGEYSNLDPIHASGYMSEKVTGVIQGLHLKSMTSYPLIQAENLVVKFPGKSSKSGAVVISADIDGYGSELSGRILPSGAQAMGSSLVLDLVRVFTEVGIVPEKDVYFVFLNGSKQGDYGMKTFMSSMEMNRQVEWIHIQNLGGVIDMPTVLGDALATTSIRQSALQLRMQMHAQNVGTEVYRGQPADPTPGFKSLIDLNIPHVIISSGSDVYTAGDELAELGNHKIRGVSGLLRSFLIRDVLKQEQPDYVSKKWVWGSFTLGMFVLFFMLINKLAKVHPGLEIFGVSIRNVSHSRSFRTISNTVYFAVPALVLMLFMIYLLLFPKTFVTTEYYGFYSGYSPYLYLKQTVLFAERLLSNGFALSGVGNVDIRILSSLIAGSLKLVVPAIAISLLIGFLKGAVDSYKPTDGKNFVSLALLSMPDVLVAFLGLQVIIVWSKNEALVNFIEVGTMRGIVMPVLALSIIPSIYVSRLALIAVEEERHKGYVKGALAKGATKRQAFLGHLLPVMMLKILDAMPSVMKLLIANLIIVEYFYGYPGIANYLITHMDSVSLVLILSMGIGIMYLALSLVFKALSTILNPMKRGVM